MKHTTGLIGLSFVAGLFFSCCSVEKMANYQIVPLPHEIVLNENVANFKLSNRTKIVFPQGNVVLEEHAHLLEGYLNDITGKHYEITSTEGDNSIILAINDTISNQEGYVLSVDEKAIRIEGSSEAGIFYGMQTLRKSVPCDKEATIIFPAATIKDAPEFAYRGAMLDVARHFVTIDSVKRFVDMLALHNINRFHWHLTEDQGWRIEIKSRPLLTEIGSKRVGTQVGRNRSLHDSIPYGGFYTQEEIKEVVDYASRRHIDIIPEIDLPGHMLAALCAYPELGCTGGPYEVWTKWGVSDDLLCPGNEETYKFLTDVMTEVVALFPYKYIHIGGDECPKTRWKACPKCQAKIKALGLKSDEHSSAEEKLQGYVMTYMEKFLSEHGRTTIGWDEVLEGGVPDATIMSWRGESGGIAAAKMGQDAIMSPYTYLYFDYYQSRDVAQEPLAIGGYISLERVYSYHPMPSALTSEEQKHIIGVQANVWSEYLKNYTLVEYMCLPRMAALSEVQWGSNLTSDYKSFLDRLSRLIPIYDIYHYNYAKVVYDVDAAVAVDKEQQSATITLSVCDDAPIYYTLDGTEPTNQSAVYSEPIAVNDNMTLKAVALRPINGSRVCTRDIVVK